MTTLRLAIPGGVVEAEYRLDSDGPDAEPYLWEAELLTPDGGRHKIDGDDLDTWGHMRRVGLRMEFQSIREELDEMAADRQPAWARTA